MEVFSRRDDEIPRGRASFGGFLPIDNALDSIAFGIYTKTAEVIEMPFGVMSGLGPANSVLHEGDNPQGAILVENTCPTSLTPLIIATLATKDRFRLNLLIYR